jgi:predicted GNAT superfamily acetyltransferase
MRAGSSKRSNSDSGSVAGDQDQIVIRCCDKQAEYEACTNLEKQIWNFNDRDVVPARLYVIANLIGGQVIGAFHQEVLVGFAMSLPGARNGRSYLYSRILAVKEQYRNAGLGRRLKLFQRDDALARGFDLIEWTFDPLEIKNAYLNVERLGVIVRRYLVNQYGNFSSALQGGLPSDRLVAEWWIGSRRVDSLLRVGSKPEATPEQTIAVPAEIYEWKSAHTTRAKALEVLMRNRQAFQNAFSNGLAVLGYDVDVGGNGTFQLGRWQEVP